MSSAWEWQSPRLQLSLWLSIASIDWRYSKNENGKSSHISICTVWRSIERCRFNPAWGLRLCISTQLHNSGLHCVWGWEPVTLPSAPQLDQSGNINHTYAMGSIHPASGFMVFTVLKVKVMFSKSSHWYLWRKKKKTAWWSGHFHPGWCLFVCLYVCFSYHGHGPQE